jgi:hypothetical protein
MFRRYFVGMQQRMQLIEVQPSVFAFDPLNDKNLTAHSFTSYPMQKIVVVITNDNQVVQVVICPSLRVGDVMHRIRAGPAQFAPIPRPLPGGPA